MNAHASAPHTEPSPLAQQLSAYTAALDAELDATGISSDLEEQTERRRRLLDEAPAKSLDDLALKLAFLGRELLSTSAAVGDVRDMRDELVTCLSCLSDAVILGHRMKSSAA